MLELVKSLNQSAYQGKLVHIDISDNQVGNAEAANELCSLIENATNLQYLNISDSNIKDQEQQIKVIKSLCSSKSNK